MQACYCLYHAEAKPDAARFAISLATVKSLGDSPIKPVLLALGAQAAA
jgi:hypothetical protein